VLSLMKECERLSKLELRDLMWLMNSLSADESDNNEVEGNGRRCSEVR